MVYSINQIKKIAVPIAKEYGVTSLRLFGSYARGEATSESDVDFYIDKGNIKGLLDYIGFIQDLEEKLQCHVDVVTTTIEDKKFIEAIKKDGVLLYEKKR
ncbi:MAG: nucleotidyltransferase domain-containing protein [Methanosphaera sp.]|nr:nucleotidyltransferase domain-containing protein [Methanosphaera sp.]